MNANDPPLHKRPMTPKLLTLGHSNPSSMSKAHIHFYIHVHVICLVVCSHIVINIVELEVTVIQVRH